LGHAAVDAGADLVVGHHPHVLQAVEVYRRTPILYSLGILYLTRQPIFKSGDSDSVFVKVTLLKGRIAGVVFLPVWINDGGQPEFVDKKDPKNGEILEMVRRFSAERKADILLNDGVGYLHFRG